MVFYSYSNFGAKMRSLSATKKEHNKAITQCNVPCCFAAKADTSSLCQPWQEKRLDH